MQKKRLRNIEYNNKFFNVLCLKGNFTGLTTITLPQMYLLLLYLSYPFQLKGHRLL